MRMPTAASASPASPPSTTPMRVASLSRRSFLDASLAGVAGLVLGFDARAVPISFASPDHRVAQATDALAFISVQEASALVRASKVSPVELTRACLARIDALNPSLNAFITVTAESALAQAQRAESEVQRGRWRGRTQGPDRYRRGQDHGRVRAVQGSDSTGGRHHRPATQSGGCSSAR